MTAHIETILKWILLESSAPACIREIALNEWSTKREPDVAIGSGSVIVTVTAVQLREFRALKAEGKALLAIKKLRDFTMQGGKMGIGLKDAKDIIDSL